LPDPRLPAHEDRRPRYDAAAEDPVELADAGRAPRGVVLVDLRQCQRLPAAGEVAGRAAANPARRQRRGPGVGGRRLILFEAVPRPAVRALAHPFGMDAAAGIAEELRTVLRFGHSGFSRLLEGWRREPSVRL